MGVEEVRRYMEAAMGKLSPAKAQELAKTMVSGQGREQVSKTARDLVEWSNRNRERLTEMVRSEVRSQMRTLGVATRDDLDALRRRVRELERAGGGKATAKRTASRKRPAPKKRSAAPKASGSGS